VGGGKAKRVEGTMSEIKPHEKGLKEKKRDPGGLGLWGPRILACVNTLPYTREQWGSHKGWETAPERRGKECALPTIPTGEDF